MKKAILIMCVWFLSHSSMAQNQINLCYMGSSSSPVELYETVDRIVDASGDYEMNYTHLGGYFRLDYFARDSMQYVDWLADYMPDIAAGNYDYAVMQFFALTGLSPGQMAFLFDFVLPDLVSRIRETGAEVVLYQRHALQGCYPPSMKGHDFEYFDNLFHLEGCVKAGVRKDTYAGRARAEGRAIPYFNDMGFLWDGGGHPGSMLVYIYACALSRCITGVDPRGSRVRNIPMQGWEVDAWSALAADDPRKRRVVDNELVLLDWEADSLQNMAMRHHLPWTQRLEENLTDSLAFQNTLNELLLYRMEYGNIDDWGLADHQINSLKSKCNDNYNALSSTQLDSIRDASKHFSQRIRDAAHTYLTTPEVEKLQNDYEEYWLTNNSKFRDDVYFFGLVAQALAQLEQDQAEASRMATQNEVLLEILSQAAENFLLERLSDADRASYMASYTWNDPMNAYAPQYGQRQLGAAGNWEQLMFMREVYFTVWEDPNLEDKLKLNYAQDVWLKADSLFVKEWNEVLSQNNGGNYKLIVSNGSGSGYYQSGATANISCADPKSGRVFDVWTGGVESIADPSSPATSVSITNKNIRVVATYKNATELTIPNFSFETPDVETRQLNPSGASWTFVFEGWNRSSVAEGLYASDSVFDATHGTQIATIQQFGWIYQDIDFPTGWYTMKVDAAQWKPWQDVDQTFNVVIGTDTVATITPTTNNEFLEYQTPAFYADGLTRVRFEGTNPLGGNNPVTFLDNVRVYSSMPVNTAALSGAIRREAKRVRLASVSNNRLIFDVPEGMGAGEVSVFSLSGKTLSVYTVPANAKATERTIVPLTQKLPPGNYIYRYRTGQTYSRGLFMQF